MDKEQWDKLAREAFEQAMLSVDIIHRTQEGKDGEIAVNIDEIKTDAMATVPHYVDSRELAGYMKYHGKEFLAEALGGTLKPAMKSWRRVFRTKNYELN